MKTLESNGLNKRPPDLPRRYLEHTFYCKKVHEKAFTYLTSFNNVELYGGMNSGGGGLELKKAKHTHTHTKKNNSQFVLNPMVGFTHTHKKNVDNPHSNKSLSIQTCRIRP